MPNITALIIVAAAMFAVLGGVTLLAHIYNLNNIKSKTVGDGQHGTARFASKSEIRRTYKQVPFTPDLWREKAKKNVLPELPQGIIVGCRNKGGGTVAMVDDADVHCMMVGAAGCGKTAYWLYPNLEYACASGMSWLCTDTKGDLYRNYGGIAKDCYGYHVAVIDLRNPTKSDGNNLLHLVNKYMDLQGDYYLPDLTLPSKEGKHIGIWGQRHARYLKQYHKIQYYNLLTSGKLNGYLADIDKQAEMMFFRLVEQMAEREGVTEKLKADNQMEWIGKMNALRSAVTGAVNAEVIFV